MYLVREERVVGIGRASALGDVRQGCCGAGDALAQQRADCVGSRDDKMTKTWDCHNASCRGIIDWCKCHFCSLLRLHLPWVKLAQWIFMLYSG